MNLSGKILAKLKKAFLLNCIDSYILDLWVFELWDWKDRNAQTKPKEGVGFFSLSLESQVISFSLRFSFFLFMQ